MVPLDLFDKKIPELLLPDRYRSWFMVSVPAKEFPLNLRALHTKPLKV
jgi:hypothetical protein